MSRRSPKRRNPAGGRGPRKAQRGKLPPDPKLIALITQVWDLPDGHCLQVQDSAGKQGVMVTESFRDLCERIGVRAREVSPRDPEAAIMAALAGLQPPAGGVH